MCVYLSICLSVYLSVYLCLTQTQRLWLLKQVKNSKTTKLELYHHKYLICASTAFTSIFAQTDAASGQICKYLKHQDCTESGPLDVIALSAILLKYRAKWKAHVYNLEHIVYACTLSARLLLSRLSFGTDYSKTGSINHEKQANLP